MRQRARSRARNVLVAILVAITAVVGLTPATPASAAAFGQWAPVNYGAFDTNRQYTLKSLANSRYVVAETSWGGASYATLLAKSTTVTRKAKFQIHGRTGQNAWEFYWVDNGCYATAEIKYAQPYTGMLRARAAVAGPWEGYQLYYNDSLVPSRSFRPPMANG
jgi:hypothetical protein